MEMLEYCKTYSIMKSSLSNAGSTDLTSQDVSLASECQHEGSIGGNGEVVVESFQRLTRPGELSLYRSVTRHPQSSETVETKLSPLKEITRSKTMVSTVKPQQRVSFESELTFAPKLNALSIKLAKERGDKLRTALNRRAAALQAETESNFTFTPKVSSNSVKIVQNMKTSFLDRQQLHVKKQKKHNEADVATHQTKTELSPVHLSKSPSCSKNANISKEMDDTSKQEGQSPEQEKFPIQALPASSLSAANLPTSIPPQVSSEMIDNKLRSPSTSPSSHDMTPKTSKTKIKKLSQGARRIEETSPYNNSVGNLYLKKHKKNGRTHKRGLTHPLPKTTAETDGWNSSTKFEDMNSNTSGTSSNSKTGKANHSRSTSQPSQYCGKMKYEDPLFEKVRHSKELAGMAIKIKKVFLCHGPYPIVRATLRRRGWVEKHFKGSLIISKKARKNNNYDSDDDSCGSGDDSDNDSPSMNASPRKEIMSNSKPSNKIVVRSKQTAKKTNSKVDSTNRSDGDSSNNDSESDDDESEDEDWKAGYEDGPDCEFNLMSRMVRNAVASFIWTVRRDDVDFKLLRKDQMVNHFSRAHSFTTKVGLCVNLRNLPWYEDSDSLSFFPRCHRLGSEEDKLDFIDDFRMSSAISIMKWVIQRYENGRKPKSVASTHDDEHVDQDKAGDDRSPAQKPQTVLPVRALTLALEACREYLRCKEHLDIDDSIETKPVITDGIWDEIVEFFYQLRSGAVIARAFPFTRECESTLNMLREHLPQVDIDGMRNVWIVKPGAKSRGRGIMCMDRLDDILKLTGNIIGQKEGRWVVQKYIERPLLIFGVKFDIRQWFLVTDWNPLTLWFYQDCYLRFCSQNFSLEDFHVSIHLANNSIQKNFDNNVTRDKRLPDENMWSSDEFRSYLNKRDVVHMWEKVIYPGMKQAVIYALESCQEIVEYRKNSFELYGADFIIGDDYKPWLIEINCSPTMGASTTVTRKLCAQVLEDTMRVVLDRKEDKNCDTGRFELAYKQAHISAPTYIGINMAVEGQGIGRKAALRRPSTSAKLTTLARPQESKNMLSTSQETTETKRDNPRPTNPKPLKPKPLKTTTVTTFVKKAEGAWAMGCICTTQQSCQVTASSCTRSTSDEKSPKGLVTRSKTGIHGDVKTHAQSQRVSRAMNIPKAVLRYSSDAGIQQRTQLPISIGPDNRSNAF